jgi:putative transposase
VPKEGIRSTTLSFNVLYCFFVIAHDRRRILHFNVTKHPSSVWIAQQLRESFPEEHEHEFLIFDRDAKFGKEVLSAVDAVELAPVRTSFKSPWQNGTAERWVGSCRRDLLDHVIALNERHLKRLLAEYVRYYHEDRTHLGLAKKTPGERKTANQVREFRITSMPRVGGLHHRYDLAA